VTTPHARPCALSTIEITVSSLPIITPLVVKVLFAQRTLADDDVRTMTTDSSALVDSSAMSTRS
jgi:hypothetical protein